MQEVGSSRFRASRSFTRLFAVILIFALGLQNWPAYAVVNGRDIATASSTHPWVASIWYAESAADYDNPYPICTGSLINEDTVLTAAHCIMDEGFYFVKVAADTLKEPVELLEVNATWQNPRYNEKKILNDVGLLRLEKPVSTDFVAPPMATSRDLKAISASKSFTIFGWGLNQNKKIATYLRTASLANQMTVAKKSLTKYGFNSLTMLSAGNYLSKEKIYAGACNGDSGGPLVTKISGQLKLVGITSWGLSGCDKKSPTIFSNVGYYQKDIADGQSMLSESVLTSNRAAPKVLESPTLTGEARVGSTLTCSPGIWSDNTKIVELNWTSPSAIVGMKNNSVAVLQEDAGQTFTCSVTGYSDAASRTIERKISIPARPSSNSPLTISGVYAIYPPVKVGDVASCSGMTWNEPGVKESLSWYASDSNSFSTSNQLLGTGKTLDITLSVGRAIAGKYLQCLSTGTGPGGSKSYFSSIQVAKPSAPLIWSVSIGGLTSGTIPPAVGSVATCNYSAEYAFSATYAWAITDMVSYPARVLHNLGNEKNVTITSDMLSQLSGNYLQCIVTAEGLGRTASLMGRVWYFYTLPKVTR
jgi:secreted trypsin-like serine protease